MQFHMSIIVVFTSVLSSLAAATEPVHVVTLGDSITKGVRPGVTKEETFASLLETGLREKGIEATVTNVGIGGERTDQALARLDRVLAGQPALVTIMYGTNDSYVDRGKQESRITSKEYEQNLKQIIKRLRAAGVQPVVMTEPRWGAEAGKNGAGEHPNVRLEKYVEVCRAVARETKTPLVDHFKHWSAAETKGTDLGDWTTDQCHPNPAGHEILTKTMLPVVLKALGD